MVQRKFQPLAYGIGRAAVYRVVVEEMRAAL
jgi:hypothetical protein